MAAESDDPNFGIDATIDADALNRDIEDFDALLEDYSVKFKDIGKLSTALSSARTVSTTYQLMERYFQEFRDDFDSLSDKNNKYLLVAGASNLSLIANLADILKLKDLYYKLSTLIKNYGELIKHFFDAKNVELSKNQRASKLEGMMDSYDPFMYDKTVLKAGSECDILRIIMRNQPQEREEEEEEEEEEEDDGTGVGLTTDDSDLLAKMGLFSSFGTGSISKNKSLLRDWLDKNKGKLTTLFNIEDLVLDFRDETLLDPWIVKAKEAMGTIGDLKQIIITEIAVPNLTSFEVKQGPVKVEIDAFKQRCFEFAKKKFSNFFRALQDNYFHTKWADKHFSGIRNIIYDHQPAILNKFSGNLHARINYVLPNIQTLLILATYSEFEYLFDAQKGWHQLRRETDGRFVVNLFGFRIIIHPDESVTPPARIDFNFMKRLLFLSTIRTNQQIKNKSVTSLLRALGPMQWTDVDGETVPVVSGTNDGSAIYADAFTGAPISAPKTQKISNVVFNAGDHGLKNSNHYDKVETKTNQEHLWEINAAINGVYTNQEQAQRPIVPRVARMPHGWLPWNKIGGGNISKKSVGGYPRKAALSNDNDLFSHYISLVIHNLQMITAKANSAVNSIYFSSGIGKLGYMIYNFLINSPNQDESFERRFAVVLAKFMAMNEIAIKEDDELINDKINRLSSLNDAVLRTAKYVFYLGDDEPLSSLVTMVSLPKDDPQGQLNAQTSLLKDLTDELSETQGFIVQLASLFKTYHQRFLVSCETLAVVHTASISKADMKASYPALAAELDHLTFPPRFRDDAGAGAGAGVGADASIIPKLFGQYGVGTLMTPFLENAVKMKDLLDAFKETAEFSVFIKLARKFIKEHNFPGLKEITDLIDFLTEETHASPYDEDTLKKELARSKNAYRHHLISLLSLQSDDPITKLTKNKALLLLELESLNLKIAAANSGISGSAAAAASDTPPRSRAAQDDQDGRMPNSLTTGLNKGDIRMATVLNFDTASVTLKVDGISNGKGAIAYNTDIDDVIRSNIKKDDRFFVKIINITEHLYILEIREVDQTQVNAPSSASASPPTPPPVIDTAPDSPAASGPDASSASTPSFITAHGSPLSPSIPRTPTSAVSPSRVLTPFFAAVSALRDEDEAELIELESEIVKAKNDLMGSRVELDSPTEESYRTPFKNWGSADGDPLTVLKQNQDAVRAALIARGVSYPGQTIESAATDELFSRISTEDDLSQSIRQKRGSKVMSPEFKVSPISAPPFETPVRNDQMDDPQYLTAKLKNLLAITGEIDPIYGQLTPPPAVVLNIRIGSFSQANAFSLILDEEADPNSKPGADPDAKPATGPAADPDAKPATGPEAESAAGPEGTDEKEVRVFKEMVDRYFNGRKSNPSALSAAASRIALRISQIENRANRIKIESFIKSHPSTEKQRKDVLVEAIKDTQRPKGKKGGAFPEKRDPVKYLYELYIYFLEKGIETEFRSRINELLVYCGVYCPHEPRKAIDLDELIMNVRNSDRSDEYNCEKCCYAVFDMGFHELFYNLSNGTPAIPFGCEPYLLDDPLNRRTFLSIFNVTRYLHTSFPRSFKMEFYFMLLCSTFGKDYWECADDYDIERDMTRRTFFTRFYELRDMPDYYEPNITPNDFLNSNGKVFAEKKRADIEKLILDIDKDKDRIESERKMKEFKESSEKLDELVRELVTCFDDVKREEEEAVFAGIKLYEPITLNERDSEEVKKAKIKVHIFKLYLSELLSIKQEAIQKFIDNAVTMVECALDQNKAMAEIEKFSTQFEGLTLLLKPLKDSIPPAAPSKSGDEFPEPSMAQWALRGSPKYLANSPPIRRGGWELSHESVKNGIQETSGKTLRKRAVYNKTRTKLNRKSRRNKYK